MTGSPAGCRTPQAADNSDTASAESRSDATIAETIEELLPFYSESSVNLREMVHNQASDGRWRWRPHGDGLAFCTPTNVSAGLQSTVPPFFDAAKTSLWRQTPFALLILGLIAVLATVVWVVKFITTKIFLADVIEPLSTERGEALREIWAPNLFLVGDAPPASEIPELAFCTIDLQRRAARTPRRAASGSALSSRASNSLPFVRTCCCSTTNARTTWAFAEQKLAMLEQIINTLNRTLVVVSAVPPSVAGGTASADRRDPSQADMTHRWDAVLSRFTVVPVVPVAPMPAMPSPASLFGGWSGAGWREIVWRISALGFSHSAKFLEQEQQDPRVDRMWRDVLPYAWHPERPPLDVGQLLVEVGERAENYYREILVHLHEGRKARAGPTR